MCTFILVHGYIGLCIMYILFYIYLLQVRVFWSNHNVTSLNRAIVDFPVGHLLALLASPLAYSIIHTTNAYSLPLEST